MLQGNNIKNNNNHNSNTAFLLDKSGCIDWLVDPVDSYLYAIFMGTFLLKPIFSIITQKALLVILSDPTPYKNTVCIGLVQQMLNFPLLLRTMSIIVFSKDFISKMCEQKGKIKRWNHRSYRDKEYPNDEPKTRFTFNLSKK